VAAYRLLGVRDHQRWPPTVCWACATTNGGRLPVFGVV